MPQGKLTTTNIWHNKYWDQSWLPNILKKNSGKKALPGGCLLNPQSRLLLQAKASIVSSGKLLFVKDGIKVQVTKWIIINV